MLLRFHLKYDAHWSQSLQKVIFKAIFALLKRKIENRTENSNLVDNLRSFFSDVFFPFHEVSAVFTWNFGFCNQIIEMMHLMLPITSSNIHLSMSWTSENDNEATSIELCQLYFIFITWFTCELDTIPADWLWSATKCFRCHFSLNYFVVRKAKKKRANEFNWIVTKSKHDPVDTKYEKLLQNEKREERAKIIIIFCALVCSVILITSDTAGYSRLTIHYYRCCCGGAASIPVLVSWHAIVQFARH